MKEIVEKRKKIKRIPARIKENVIKWHEKIFKQI